MLLKNTKIAFVELNNTGSWANLIILGGYMIKKK